MREFGRGGDRTFLFSDHGGGYTTLLFVKTHRTVQPKGEFCGMKILKIN